MFKRPGCNFAVINDDYVLLACATPLQQSALLPSVTLTHLQKKRKYGAVVSIITTATWSSISVEQDKRSNGTTIIRQQENRNMTRDGAVLWQGVRK